MKHGIVKIGGAFALGAILLGAAPQARAESQDKDAQHLLAAAAQGEQKASDLQAAIDEQLRLKAINLSQWKLRKSPPNRDIAAADKKYDATIAALEAKQSDLLALAHFHRLQAEEIQTADAGTGNSVN
jgi:UDP-2,3-diacylglucosamine pyrophosphatase LpxH